MTAQQNCTAVKVRTVAKVFGCFVKAHNRALLGGESADTSGCGQQLVARFARSDATICTVSDEAQDALAVVEQTSDAVLAALGADVAATDSAKRCVTTKNKAGARYAACAAKRFARLFSGVAPPSATDEDPCYAKLAGGFVRAENSLSCVSTDDASDARRLVGPVSAYLVGADLTDLQLQGAFLHGARLAGATLHCNLDGADLTDADLTDANLASVHAYGLLGCPVGLDAAWSCSGNVLIGPGANLNGDDLRGFDLAGRNLDGVHYSWADLAGANLAGASMKSTRSYSANLTGADLANADLAGSYLEWGDLTDANLAGADLTDMTLYVVTLTRTNLSNAVLANTGFPSTVAVGADLTGVDLATARLDGSRFVDLLGCPATLAAEYRCVAQAIFGPRMSIALASFPGIDLSGADLSDARLVELDLTGANLQGADLSGVEFVRTLLTGADVAGADISDGYWNNVTCPDGSNSTANGGSCCGHYSGGPPVACSP